MTKRTFYKLELAEKDRRNNEQVTINIHSEGVDRSQSEDTEQIRFHAKNTQLKNSEDDEFLKTCDDMMMAEGGLVDEVEKGDT